MDMDDDACYRAFQMRDARFDGRIFSGVTSTGIYCRPICPARTPKRENMRFYRSAAAAQEAGFRPCLRCRPETSPDLGSWRGTSNTVSRALALIEAGALDNGDVDSLAERLGVGERQLRRLFHQHVGASPVAVAQTRRVLLAKQLLHETRMPMAEVAMAAGFGSVRRFNETFQQLFDRPPAKLRRLGGADVAAGEGGAATIRLPYRAPYDWDAMLAFLTARAIPGVETVRDGRYARALCVGQARGVLMIEPGDGAYLKATLRFPKVEVWPAVIARVRRVFDLAADPAVIEAHLSEDPALAPLVAARPGLRAPGAWDGFELAVRAVLGQQITVHAARMLAGKITAEHGVVLEDEAANAMGLTHFFPEPAALALIDVETLPMPRARGRALVGLAAAAAADPELFGMRRSLDEAVAALRALPGVGEWTAQYIAMRALREPDAFPSADIGLMRALEGPDGLRPSPAELLARAERWRPWRAYAASHLWAADPKNPSEAKHAKAA
ncbi:3-methyladenine DNA glycosylase 2 [Phenylobacterium sp. Root77]|uniref:DNA-3-methyladenine glycosylase 2 family protein n=1 Tax=unclassified Phenylobacterium TaxID=2640670 RepID=UPI0006F899AA|nr:MULTISPECIES: AlkA N-terminal domain-containing protein [unclassified Phenylobacterium]KQW66378.1 3-methyladenine DNA glycosylase 2 [Phenylobacterium sp. Root1277]KQW88885.1 3-methyladenine DNA glycosylase 2 [Phenylobacterium sp. Root1290]KRC42261.1 3-methyladenine DNA glycosylase 2 [Phenylobacterium sp. Root77]